MISFNENIGKAAMEIQSFIMIKDCTMKDGSILRKGSEFIVDFCNENYVCMHFPTKDKNHYSVQNDTHEFLVEGEYFLEVSKPDFNNIAMLINENKILKNEQYNEYIQDKLQEEDHEDKQLLLIETFEEAIKQNELYKKIINKIVQRYRIPQAEIYKIIDENQEKQSEK